MSSTRPTTVWSWSRQCPPQPLSPPLVPRSVPEHPSFVGIAANRVRPGADIGPHRGSGSACIAGGGRSLAHETPLAEAESLFMRESARLISSPWGFAGAGRRRSRAPRVPVVYSGIRSSSWTLAATRSARASALSWCAWSSSGGFPAAGLGTVAARDPGAGPGVHQAGKGSSGEADRDHRDGVTRLGRVDAGNRITWSLQSGPRPMVAGASGACGGFSFRDDGASVFRWDHPARRAGGPVRAGSSTLPGFRGESPVAASGDPPSYAATSTDISGFSGPPRTGIRTCGLGSIRPRQPRKYQVPIRMKAEGFFGTVQP